MQRLQDPHHRPGKEALGLQDRAKSPFQSDALLNRDGKMTEIRDLVSEEVKHVRVGDKFLALRRRVGDLLKAVNRRKKSMAGSALLNSLGEFLLGFGEGVLHNLGPAQERSRRSLWVRDTNRNRQVKRPG